MILTTLSDSDTYRGISPALDLALEWLAAHAGDTFDKGVTAIDNADGWDISVKCEEPALMPREKAQLEVHRRFIDIHVPLKGTETIGWAPLDALQYVRAPYDAEKDVAFYADAAHSLLHVKKGQIAIMFPADAHAPNIGLGTHRKLCIKVPVL